MTLVELCEPLFQYICRLSRSARKGGSYEYGQVQAEIKALLADIKAKSADTQPPLIESYDKIEIVLMGFCDFMIKESALSWAKDWQELAFEKREMAMDEKFFDILEDTLKDRSPSAPERLGVFYTCLGLGFTGFYTGQPEFLRRKMKEIAGRLQSGTESGAGDIARICPDAYEHVDTRDLVEPPSTKLFGIGIALLGLVIVLFIANAFIYGQQIKEIQGALSEINAAAPPTPVFPSVSSTPKEPK